MATDIAYILFVEILKMTQYPGGGFTGNIINDLIMFFFIPMVFIILFIYILLGRIVYGVTWLRALLGIAIFLFMVVNGMFATFAILSGQYFYLLIVILGGLYFIPSHFGARPAGMPREGLSGGGGEISAKDKATLLHQLDMKIEQLEKKIAAEERKIPSGGDRRHLQPYHQELATLMTERARIEEGLIPGKREAGRYRALMKRMK